MTELFREHGDVVCLGMGPIDAWLLHHPDAVKHVLQDNNQNYTKGPIIGRVKALLGEGLFTSEATSGAASGGSRSPRSTASASPASRRR